MYLSQVLRDVKNELGPLLKELGLRWRLHPDPYWYHRIYFETMGAVRWRSPVELQFPVANKSKKDKADWADVLIEFQDREYTSVGTNGWIMYDESPTANIGTFIGSKDEVLRIASETIRRLELFPSGPPFPEGPGLPKVVHYDALRETLEIHLYRFFEERGMSYEDIEVHRSEDGGEWISFLLEDHPLELHFTADQQSAILAFEGEEYDRCAVCRVELPNMLRSYRRRFIL
jgi:hypothetical protein